MKFICSISFLLITFSLFSNNIQVKEVSIVSQNTQQDYYMIELDLSWDNSWRTSTLESNWDAAWVFVKATIQNQQEWQHATLNYVDGSNDGHVTAPGSIVETAINTYGSSGGIGVFVYRDSDGIGNVNFENMQLRWNYGDDGFDDDDVVEISVSAIEMVYVPQGWFYVGDGQGDFGQFELNTSGQPFRINNEGPLTLGGGSPLSLGNSNAINMLNDDDFDDLTSRTLPGDFPKGYAPFYCMKYEVSQGQYASFLQHLSTEQRSPRSGPHYVNAENVFPILDGNHWATTETPWRPVNFIDWPDMAAYLDWSGLRPMSELEFEKACRGPLNPVNNEFAWGNDSWFIQGLFSYQNEGTNYENISSGIGINAGNANSTSIYSGAAFPVRCGIFAASAENKTRQETGATYWGIMEMTGNCYELVISLGSSQTRDFSGRHGDGNLPSSGSASFTLLSDWVFEGGTGIGFRSSEVSTRYGANYNNAERERWHGIRGVRSAN